MYKNLSYLKLKKNVGSCTLLYYTKEKGYTDTLTHLGSEMQSRGKDTPEMVHSGYLAVEPEEEVGRDLFHCRYILLLSVIKLCPGSLRPYRLQCARLLQSCQLVIDAVTTSASAAPSPPAHNLSASGFPNECII